MLSEHKENKISMTLQEAKEIVARGRGYDSWKDVEDELYGSKLINICNDAAETYARSKWNEAAREVLQAMNGHIDEGDIPIFKP